MRFLLFTLIRLIRILKQYLPSLLTWNSLTILTKLYLTIALKLNLVILLKHYIIILINIRQQLLTFLKLILKIYSLPRFPPILINMLQLLFLLRFSYRHIMYQLIHTTNILQPRLMIPHNIRMIQCRKECHLVQ